ncbi:sulfate adenylyltransferase subunit 1 [Lishizhenia sp.]|uniref:sulfate adenylyltransferase subunit 1 n=1 Tax=Lishizhenia sp. TaxID=2497594 RepID=UPI00299D7153|nr:GTP-binding protein [Lishizhenia sp.]MDX1446346.1 GTP-binding protein [Lishizhenia sp.]
MEVLKIATAGSVDDGKSTLIGRILYDTQSLTQDKLEAIEKTSQQKGYDYLDFSLATDGLVAEREQGITIDVAHIYFSTPHKSYIIADTPGHVEYTRNMVTGASTSQASIILIDARKGVTEQTKRHFFINNLLRIKDIVVAINKMDLVAYSQEVFEKIKNDFRTLSNQGEYEGQNISFIPVSALHGDNVVHHSTEMPWYQGLTVLDHLESLTQEKVYDTGKPRFPVQMVIRPKTEEYHDFRAYAGKVYGGDLQTGDEVVALPSLQKSSIKDIYFYNEKYQTAVSRSSVSITLEDEINLSRGDMLVKAEEVPQLTKEVEAIVCWMDNKTMEIRNKYTLQHGVNKVLAMVSEIESKIKTDFSGTEQEVKSVEMNDITLIKLKLNKEIYCDPYKDHRTNGSFILIDNTTNHTVGVGFVQA